MFIYNIHSTQNILSKLIYSALATINIVLPTLWLFIYFYLTVMASHYHTLILLYIFIF